MIKNPFFYTNKLHNVIKFKPFSKFSPKFRFFKKFKRPKNFYKKYLKKKHTSYNLIKKFGKTCFDKKFLFSKTITTFLKFRKKKKKYLFSIFTNIFLKKTRLNFFFKNS